MADQKGYDKYAWIALLLSIAGTIPQFLQVLNTWSVGDINGYSLALYTLANGVLLLHAFAIEDYGLMFISGWLVFYNMAIIYVKVMPRPAV